MRVNRPHQVLDCRFELHGSYSFRNQLCRLRPDYVNSEDLSVLGIRHNLDETFVFADYARALYDFDWDEAHPNSPYARIEATTMFAFKRK